MASDRGGLQYKIAVSDDFSAATQSFIAGIRAAKDEFAAFRSEVAKGKGAASSIRELSKATEASAKSRKRAVDEESNALKRLAAESKRQRDLERESSRIRNTQGRDAARRAQAEVAAERRRLQAIQNTERAREKESRRVLSAMRKDEANFQREQLRRLQELAGRRSDVERQRVAQAKAARAEQSALDRLNPEVQGKKKADDLVQRRATAQAEVAELRRLGREDLITKNLRRQSGELKDSARSANSLLFTFRRLIGVLAAFQIARAVVGGFRDLIVEGVRFNDEIRQAEIGIAGLVTGLADVRNEQGQSVTLGEEYARSLSIARKQVELLRQDALLTTATFGQLLDTFQIAIGPGFAAGLNLDEIRKLSVLISQAATAIGLPQNQLAEEIRSLLSGTIQARTTRIATSLQITNADIRRLKQSGELFDFLESKFKSLGLAAEQAARQTLSGIGNLVKDATSALLGKAAQPLFEELISLGNEVFDQVLTIRDASGDIKPNPEAVKAFRTFFDALKEGVAQARELGRALGFEGLQNILRSFGVGLNAALQFALGALRPILGTINLVLEALRTIGNVLRLDVNGGLGETSRLVGTLVGSFLVLRTGARIFGVQLSDALDPKKARALGEALRASLSTPLGKGGVVALALLAVGKGFETILEHVLDLNLSLADTARLLGQGIATQLDDIVTKGLVGLTTVAEGIKKFFTTDADAKAEIEKRAKLFRDALRADNAAQNAELEALLLEIEAKNGRRGKAPATAQEFSAETAAAKASEFGEIVSNVESVVAKANTAIGELDNELRELAAQFDAAGGKTGAQGFAGDVDNAFAAAASSAKLKTTEIRDALRELQEQIQRGVGSLDISPDRAALIRKAANTPAGKGQDRALAALKLTAEEGKLVSFLRDEARLQETIADLSNQTADAARLKVAIAAREALPALQRELGGLQQQAIAEGAVAAAVTQRLGARRMEAIEAQNALAAQRQASAQRIADIKAELAAAKKQSAPLTFADSTAEERAREKERAAANIALAAELEKTLALEEAIAAAKAQQLEFALRQAQLAAEGSFTGGIRAGFEQLAEELPTLFDAAKNLVTGITQSFVSAASQLFRDLFDPAVEVDLRERLGQLLLSVGQQIFEQTTQSLIQAAIQYFTTRSAQEAALAAQRSAQEAALASERLAAETAIAAVRATGRAIGGVARGGLVPAGGFAKGGRIDRVPSLVAKARGYARGGAPFGRAAGISSKDTVPAWLTPGEFVVRKPVVDSLGVGFFQSVNAGNFSAPPAGAPAAGPGFAAGGRVTKSEPAVSRRQSDAGVQIIPVQVTSEREMDRLQAGGKNAKFRFYRDNAGTIRSLLGLG